MVLRRLLAPGNAMEITYELEREDIWNYRKYRMAHDYLYIPTRFLSIYVLAFCMGYIFHHDFTLMAAGSFVVACFYLIRDLLTTKSQVNKLISRNPYWILPQTIRLQEDGLDWATDGGETKIPWRQFKAVEDLGNYLMFRMQRWRAIIVPKQAFISPQEAQEFLELSQTFWHSAKT